MRKLTTASTLVEIAHYRNVLTSEGIDSFVRNEHLGSIVGEMPFQEVWPELWVVNDLDFDRAKQLIDKSVLKESPSESWRCAACGTENEGQFAVCWQCGAHHA